MLHVERSFNAYGKQNKRACGACCPSCPCTFSCVVIELQPRGSRVVSYWIVESKCRASVSLALSERSLYIFVSSANILKVEEILEDTIIIKLT